MACVWLLNRFSARYTAPQACACGSYRRAAHVFGVLHAPSRGRDGKKTPRRFRRARNGAPLEALHTLCVGSETARGMRNAGRALLCVHGASSHVSHACPRGDVAA
jgi:hypothetical protein